VPRVVAAAAATGLAATDHRTGRGKGNPRPPPAASTACWADPFGTAPAALAARPETRASTRTLAGPWMQAFSLRPPLPRAGRPKDPAERPHPGESGPSDTGACWAPTRPGNPGPGVFARPPAPRPRPRETSERNFLGLPGTLGPPLVQRPAPARGPPRPCSSAFKGAPSLLPRGPGPDQSLFSRRKHRTSRSSATDLGQGFSLAELEAR